MNVEAIASLGSHDFSWLSNYNKHMTYKVRVLQNRLQGDAICNTNSVRVMLTVCLGVCHAHERGRTHITHHTAQAVQESKLSTGVCFHVVSQVTDFMVRCLSRPLLAIPCNKNQQNEHIFTLMF